MSSSVEIDPGPGLVMRQLLPSDYRAFNREEYRRMWRWVLWADEPITFHEAMALRKFGGDEHWCYIHVERGPKGGWTGATFTQPRHKVPFVRKAYTFYMGWVFLDHVPSHRKIPTPAEINAASAGFEQQRANIVLHA